MNMPVEISDARRVIFGGIIDYAGLFPPASLDMGQAVAGFRASRDSEYGWIVDRFIVPASRLVELAAHLTSSMGAGEGPWPLSVLADLGPWPGFDDTHRAIADYQGEMAGASSVELVEVKLPAGADELEVGDCAVGFAGRGAVPFFEMPPAELPLDQLVAARRQRDVAIGAKLRCGGLTAGDFPTPGRVADFISGCIARALPFKCTAGLHHPVRHASSETGFTHHGFLNIATAALAAAEGGDGVVEIISDTDPDSFAVGRAGLKWRDRVFGSDAMAAARSGAFVGYGSCDFDEPVADLLDLGMLP